MITEKRIPLSEAVEEITVGYVGPMAEEYVDNGIPFLRSLNVRPFKFSDDNIKFITPEFHKKIKKSALSPGDVVAVRTGVPGASCVIPDCLEDANCSDLVVIRCGEKSDPHFVSYYINSVTQSQINSNLVGAIQKHFNIGSAKEILFPHIDKPTQQKIAAVLSTLDAKIELNNRINAELEAMAKLLYDYWFVQFDFPITAAQATALGNPALKGKPYKSSGGKMVFNPTLKRKIPAGWSGVYVEDILAKEQRHKKIPNSEINTFGSIPVIDQSKSFICGYTDDQEAIISDHPKIIFGDHTRVVKFINFDFARGADGTQVITSNDKRIPQHLLYQMLTAMDLSNYGYARHFKFLKQQKLVLPAPEVSADYETFASTLYKQILATQTQTQHLTQLRDWLLPMLMNGQVTVD